MYAVASVVYGIPMTVKLYDALNEAFDGAAEKLTEHSSFEGLYSGMAPGYEVGFIGAHLGEFDGLGCQRIDPDNFKIEDFSVRPTVEQVAEFQQKMDKLEPEVRAVVEEHGEKAGVWIVWGTS